MAVTNLATPGDECRNRLAKRQEQTRRLQRRLKRLVRTKTLAISTVVGYAVIDPTAAFLLVPLAVLLVPMVFVQHGMTRTLYRERLAVAFYRNAVARIEDRWIGRGDTGARYLTSDPLFADDLDLFGHGSLFQRLCTARTSVGKDTLARWLLQPGTVTEVCERQTAVQELSESLESRERLAVLELDRCALRTEAMREWGNAEDPLRETACLWRVGAAAVAIVVWSWFGLGFWLIVAVLLIEIGLCNLLRSRLQSITGPAVEALQAHAELAVIRKATRPISFRCHRLSRILSTIDSPATALSLVDAFYGFVVRRPLLLLVVRQTTSHVDRWRRAVASQSLQRLTAWGELEALASLAQYRFEQPDTTFAEVVSSHPCYEATQLGHPLIPAARRVANDLILNDSPRLLIISGSNMSGKSTMLRTVGINAVLALCGAPVCAARLRLSPCCIGTAMRFRDSLEQQTSHFYAVIERLRRIMELPTDERPLLFLIDEILQGTNSRDRVAGAQALVRSLVGRNGLGLITTHDLELTRMIDSFGGRAANVHFVDQLVDGELRFDYIMRSGVVQTSNAIDLMRRIGLDV